MQLTRMFITLQGYGPNEGQYAGIVHFKDEAGEIHVVLDSSLSAEVLALCADSLVVQAKKMGELMTANIIERMKQKQLKA